MSENVLAGRYELVEPIGTGGMAEVHRAWDSLLRRHVAVKLFQPGFDAAADRRFDNEVRTLANLSHPGLVSVYDADTHGGTPFVVLQLIEGRTLRDRIADGALPLDEVRRIGAALADALAHVHAHDLVHRDVKPSNILLDAEDNAFLADFGLAHLTGATRLTRTDQLVGTAAYLAPEQVLGKEIGHPTDVYALGLVLLECLTGRREYQGGDVEAAVARLHRPPAIPADLPADVSGLLSRMTSSAPEERPTADDCAGALREDPFLSGVPVVPLPLPLDNTVVIQAADTAVETTAPRRGMGPAWKTLAASAGVLIGAIVVTTAATSGQEPTNPIPAAPPAASASAAPQSTTAAGVAADTPQGTVGFQDTVTQPAAQGGAQQQVTTNAPRMTQPAAPPVGSTARPVTDPVTEITTVPVTTAPVTTVPVTTAPVTTAPEVTTTEQQPPNPTAAPTSENPDTRPESAEPTSSPGAGD